MLALHHITRRFGAAVAVDDVSFTITPGAMTGFVGANGAGKTTTMRMIMGVLEPSAGGLTWYGRPLTRADAEDFGYMPEERGLYPKQRILDQLIYLGEIQKMTRGDARRAAIDHLDRFGLAGRMHDHLEALSLGNQQRVQIIAAVMSAPTALILDEPFSGLDPGAVDAMSEVLRTHTERGIPVLFSSHQLDLVDRLCDSLLILSHGRLVASGSEDQLRAGAPHRYRIRVSGDAGWVRDVPGIACLDVDGTTALVDITTPGAELTLPRTALDRGDLYEFARVVPSLSEIYREVTA